VIPRLLQIGDTQVERYLPKTNAGWPPLDEGVIAIVKSPFIHSMLKQIL
jgi:hypothetical protein